MVAKISLSSPSGYKLSAGGMAAIIVAIGVVVLAVITTKYYFPQPTQLQCLN